MRAVRQVAEHNSFPDIRVSLAVFSDCISAVASVGLRVAVSDEDRHWRFGISSGPSDTICPHWCGGQYALKSDSC